MKNTHEEKGGIKIVESKNNSDFSFKDLPDDIQEFIFQLEKDHVISLLLSNGFKIENIGLYKNAVTNFTPCSESSRFIKNYFETFFTKQEDYLKFSKLFPQLNTLISTGKKDPFLDGEKGTHSGGSHPPFFDDKKAVELRDPIPRDYRYISPKDLSNRILETRDEIGIWISKTDMDHVLRWNAKLDLSKDKEKQLFAKLINSFKAKRIERFESFELPGYKSDLEYFEVKQDNTGWIHIIKITDGYCLTVSLHESHKRLNNIKKDVGTIRVKLKRNMDLQLIFEHYFKVFHFLTEEEHQQLLDLFMDEREMDSKTHLFYVHLANAIGPEKVVEEELKNGHVSVFLRNGYGGKSDVNVLVDYSKGPEIEVQGAARPSLTLRKLIVDPVGASDSIAAIDYKINNSIINQNRMIQNQDAFNDNLDFMETELYDNNQSLILLHKNSINRDELLSEFSEVQARQFGHEIQSELYQIELKEHLKQVFQAAKANSDNVAGVIIGLEQGIQELKENYADIFNDYEKEIFTGINIVSDKIDSGINLVSNQINNLDKKISDEFKDLKDFISAELNITKNTVKNWIYLLITKMTKVQNFTIKQVVEKLSLPKSTLLYYLNKLQEGGFLESQTLKTGKRGRPPRLFTFTKKLKQKLKTK